MLSNIFAGMKTPSMHNMLLRRLKLPARLNFKIYFTLHAMSSHQRRKINRTLLIKKMLISGEGISIFSANKTNFS
jgi:hypothetical protein